MNKIELSYFNKIEFDDKRAEDNEKILPLPVKGVSVKKGYIKDKNFIITSKEINNIVSTLKKGIDGNGAYILKDHGYKSASLFGGMKSVDTLIGRINNAKNIDGVVHYSGVVSSDEELAKKIKNKLITASSVSLRAENVYCSICGAEYGTCNHLLGQEYPDEGLHESVEEFIDEMGGVAKAALVGENLTAVEQSVVLFPAVEEATVSAFSMEFSEGSKDFINKIEKRKILDNELEFDEDDIIMKLTKIVETFNKENKDYIDSEDSKMTEEKVAELTVAVTKLESMVEELKADKDKLEKANTELNSQLSDLNAEFNTTKGLLKKYQDKEAAELKKANEEVERKILNLAKERKLEVEYNFEELSLAGKRKILETLEASKITAQATLPDNNVENKKTAELKAEIKKILFGE